MDAEKTADYPPDELERHLIYEKDLGCGFRLACRVGIECDMMVEFPESSRFIPEVVAKPATQQLLDEALAVRGIGESPLKGYLDAMDAFNLSPIIIFSPTASLDRMRSIAFSGRGFIYCVARKGVTGENTDF